MAEDALSGKLRCTYRSGLVWEYTSVLTLQALAYGIEATSTMANAQEAFACDAVANNGEPSPTTNRLMGMEALYYKLAAKVWSSNQGRWHGRLGRRGGRESDYARPADEDLPM